MTGHRSFPSRSTDNRDRLGKLQDPNRVEIGRRIPVVDALPHEVR